MKKWRDIKQGDIVYRWFWTSVFGNEYYECEVLTIIPNDYFEHTYHVVVRTKTKNQSIFTFIADANRNFARNREFFSGFFIDEKDMKRKHNDIRRLYC